MDDQAGGSIAQFFLPYLWSDSRPAIAKAASQMSLAADSLFLSHADPMWIYDLASLRFLAVNESAIIKYGYSREEFLAMTIADIRPPEDHAALKENIASSTKGRNEAGVWRHCLKSGEVIHVDITGHNIEHHGRQAELISARNVSRLVCAERTAQQALAREKAARHFSDKLAQQFQLIFDSIPGKFLVISPESREIIAVSDGYLAAAGLSRAQVAGQHLLDALPRQPSDTAHGQILASFSRAVATGQPDLLGLQKVIIPQPDVADGEIVRYWAVSNTPVTSPDERLIYVMLRIQDVTDAIAFDGADLALQDGLAVAPAKIDLVSHTHHLKTDNLRLAELAAQLRTTQRLLDTGTWEYEIAENRLVWSENVYRMFGVANLPIQNGLEDYAALVHPDDRAAMRSGFNDFLTGAEKQFQFAHQVVHSGGSIVHVRGMLEKVQTAKGMVLSGVVQNVTETVQSASDLDRAKRLLEIAGTSAKFGAWRYDKIADRFEWSAQTAHIHDEAVGHTPDLAQGVSYFADLHRCKIMALFRSCLDQGAAFDETLEMISATGRRLWVRTTGEAERDDAGRIIAINGALQDISELVTVRKRAEDSEKLLKIAGRAVKLGGWSVSLEEKKVFWTDGVAAIHELPTGTMPTFDGGINFFAPEDQAAARQVFDACANDGIPFDDVRDLITAKGNRITVRSLGEPVRNNTGKITGVQGAFQDISELTKARRQTLELSQRILRTFESIRDGFFILDSDWRFTLVNPEATRILSMDQAQLIGKIIWEVFPQTEVSDIGINYKKARATGETQRLVAYSEDMSRWYDVAIFPSEDEISVYFRDVTDRRQEQEHLRLVDAAVSRLNEIVIITDGRKTNGKSDPKIVFVNDAFVRRSGFTREEAIGKSPRMLQGPKTQRAELDRIKNALDNWKPVRAELINYTKSGEEIWLEIDIVPVANDVSVFTHWVAIERDITKRRKAEDAVRLSEKRFRMIARATGNAVWEWDVAGDHEWWSEGLVDIFGHKPDAAGQLPTVWRNNVHPDDRARVDTSWNRLKAGETDAMLERYQFRRGDGSWAMVEDRAFAIRDDQGRAIRLLGSMADISERQNLEERLRQSQKLEAVGQLTGGIAHDFNNLLTIIMGNAELLQERLDATNPLRRFADMSAIAAARGAELTNRLLSFSRKQPLSPRVTNVNEVVGGIEDMLSRTLGEDIEIKISPAPHLWNTEVDRGQLEAALLNLANNSRDAMPSGGAINIVTENRTVTDTPYSAELGLKTGEYVVISLNDSGEGISQDHISRVFEPFFTTKAVGKGTGLGLSMVYGFVKQTGGHIRIVSELVKGTTVELYFPKWEGEQTTLASALNAGPAHRGHETILVVEDDTLILEQLTVQLSGLGYQVVSATDGWTALTLLGERSDIDLLFTDVVLPGGMNGRQIADAALVIRPQLRILFTSGYSENAIAHDGRLDPGVELLSKPYGRTELAIKIRSILATEKRPHYV